MQEPAPTSQPDDELQRPINEQRPSEEQEPADGAQPINKTEPVAAQQTSVARPGNTGQPPLGEQPPTRNGDENLPILIGVGSLAIITLVCVVMLYFLSYPPDTPISEAQTSDDLQAAEQTQLADQAQPDAGAPAINQAELATATQATEAADTVAAATSSATTLGLVTQIATTIGAIAATAVGGIAGLLVPRSGNNTG